MGDRNVNYQGDQLMKSQPKLLAVLTAAALSAGCASGGARNNEEAAQVLTCILMPLFCGSSPTQASDGRSSSAGSPPPPQVPFATWSELPRGAETEVKSVMTSLTYQRTSDGPINATLSSGSISESSERVLNDAQANLVPYGLYNPYSNAMATTLAAIGHPGIDFRQQGDTSLYSQPAFSTLPIPSDPFSGNPYVALAGANRVGVGVIANPYVLGWEYQSFGVWNNSLPLGGGIIGSTFGAPTPASAVPTNGSATFTGKLAGLYVSPAGQGSIAAADLSVNANFSTRSLGFASSGTTTTRDLATATAAPHLNLSGTLTYSPAANTFTGTLSNAGGTMGGSSTGRYYGPAAQELGGVFAVKSPATVESFIGAYGAKR